MGQPDNTDPAPRRGVPLWLVALLCILFAGGSVLLGLVVGRSRGILRFSHAVSNRLNGLFHRRGSGRVPQWVLDQPLEKIDINTGAVMTRKLGEWMRLGEKNGMYKNPSSGQYTMAAPITCAACGATIPRLLPPASVVTPQQAFAWEQQLTCPKCGKNPYVGAPAGP